jgi:3-oxoadipate enol-lactonase
VLSVVLLTGFLWGGDPRLTLQNDLWLDLIRTNHQAYTRLLLLSGLSPAFLMNLGASNIKDMVAGSTAMVNWEGFARQVELNLKVDIRAQAQRATTPVLVIGATQDHILNSPQTRALADSIPGASYKEVDAGHIALFERTDEFIALATDFLSQQHRWDSCGTGFCAARLDQRKMFCHAQERCPWFLEAVSPLGDETLEILLANDRDEVR